MTLPSFMPPFAVREARLPEDYAAIAAVINAAQPDWPTSAADLERRDQQRDPEHYFTQLVAEQGGRVVGVGGVGHDDFSFAEWKYWGGLNVHPDARGQGVGAALYAELLRRLQERGAREIRTMSSSKPEMASGRRFLEERGWKSVWERYESEIDTAGVDLHIFGDLLAKVAAEGVRLVSLAELEADPERNRKLHELDWILFQDVPLGTALTKKTLEQWVKEEIDDPQLRPGLSFVAVRDTANDPLTGNYVGYSTLGQNASGFYYIGMTGVLRSERGRGVAKALKVAAMRALQAAGGGVIKTFNDSPNKAMLQMNEGLGFRRTATLYRYELLLDGEG